MNEKLYLIIDTETTNTLDDPICYDIGFAVINESGKVYTSASYVIADVFCDKELMESAYFADKIPQYWDDIKSGKRILCSFYNVRKAIKDVMKRFDIDTIIAHNSRFDYRSTNTTQRYLSKSKYRYFFPYGTKVLDTLKMAREIFGNDTAYIDYCTNNEHLTTNGKPRLTAEILYRYLTNDKDFTESHTALEDVLIEKEIFAECLRRNPSVDGNLW